MQAQANDLNSRWAERFRQENEAYCARAETRARTRPTPGKSA